MIVREPVGVVGMITPWNWPLNQIACKVAPALAAGCTMVLKPSEYTPTSALIFAEILHEAGVPKGVFNLINGLGTEVGAALQDEVVDVGREPEVNGRKDGVVALAGVLDCLVADVVDEIGVVAQAADHDVGACAAVQDVAAGIAESAFTVPLP